MNSSKNEDGEHLSDDFTGLKVTVDAKDLSLSLKYEAPYRWHWTDDMSMLQPYTDEVNSLIESYHDAMLHRGGPHRVLTPEIIRYVDDKPQRYYIDFDQNLQINALTKYQRKISRVQIDVSVSCDGRWYLLNEKNAWTRYETLIEGKIESAFINYTKRGGSSKLSISFPGRPEQYEIDFVEGTQRNTVSGTKRSIKRAT